MAPNQVASVMPVILAVKNTFIDLEESTAKEQRRTASVPPSVRLAVPENLSEASTIVTDSSSDDGTALGSSSTSSSYTGLTLRKHSVDSLSTNDNVANGSPIIGLSPSASPVPSPRYLQDSASTSPALSYCMSPPIVVPLPYLAPDGIDQPREAQSTFDDLHGAGAADGCSIKAQANIAVVQKKRLALNSGAKAWIPGDVPPKGDGPFQAQYKDAVENVRISLESSEYVVSAEVVEAPAMWYITISVHHDHLHKRERLLTIAKSAILQAAERSQSIYVLGYRMRPFANTPYGFSCMLGGMLNESHACWQSFAKGFCCNEAACRWEHPAYQMGVEVALQVSASY